MADLSSENPDYCVKMCSGKNAYGNNLADVNHLQIPEINVDMGYESNLGELLFTPIDSSAGSIQECLSIQDNSKNTIEHCNHQNNTDLKKTMNQIGQKFYPKHQGVFTKRNPMSSTLRNNHPVQWTPLATHNSDFNRPSSTMSLRPRILTWTSTPLNIAVSSRERQSSLSSSGYESGTSFDSASNSSLLEIKPASDTENALLEHENESLKEAIPCESESLLMHQQMPRSWSHDDLVSSTQLSEGKIQCHEVPIYHDMRKVETPFTKFLYHLSDSKTSGKINCNLNYLEKSTATENALRLKKLSSSSVPIGLDKPCKVPNVLSKYSLDITYKDSFKFDSPVERSAKHAKLSTSSPDVLPLKKSVASYKDDCVGQQKKCDSSELSPNNEFEEQIDLCSFLKPFDKSYIPRAFTLAAHETEAKISDGTVVQKALTEALKAKRRLTLDDTVIKETDEKKQHLVAVSAPPETKSQPSALNVSSKQVLLPELSQNCGTNFKGENTASLQKPVLNEPQTSSKITAPAKTSWQYDQESGPAGLSGFEFIHHLARVEADRMQTSNILLSLLNKATFILPQVLLQLTPEDILSFSQVNKQCRKIVNESQILSTMVKNFKHKRFVAVSSIGKENLVHRGKNFLSDPGMSRRALGAVNYPARSLVSLYVPPARSNLLQDNSNNADTLNSQPNPLVQPHPDRDNLAPVWQERALTSNNHITAKTKPCQQSRNNSEMRKDDVIEESLTIKMTNCPSASCSVGEQLDNAVVEQHITSPPRRILGAIQCAVSSIQAAVSPKKRSPNKLAPDKNVGNDGVSGGDVTKINESHNKKDSANNSGGFPLLRKCNMLNHAIKTLVDRSQSTNNLMNAGSVISLNKVDHIISCDASPVKSLKTTAKQSKALKKQLRRL
ncbi:uncharacterized protein LOC108678732 [Hyalella azteca]|uniref:Uncharacterized protein LOC108678732 n=1 Tax=Hyalella azteca TaxID=294128 RepID=A0A8B7PBT8_HYAAZ|nr:uncharacterized protein LOC108678732 [Hyalella azteca]